MIWLKRLATLFIPEALDWLARKLERRRDRKREKSARRLEEKRRDQLEEKTPTDRPKGAA